MHDTLRLRITSVLLFALLLGGCGKDEPATPTTTTAAGKRVQVPETPAEIPHVRPADQPKVSFLTSEPVEVEHDYNQHLVVDLHNDGPGMATLRVRATAPEDLPTGFVGIGAGGGGGESIALGIPAGETWQVPLLVHADHAASSSYEVLLEAIPFEGGEPLATAKLAVQVKPVVMKLETGWGAAQAPLARARLVKVLRIRNVGPNVSDLSVAFVPAEGTQVGAVRLRPVVERSRVLGGGEIHVEVSPRLHPAFQEVAGEIVVTGLGQELRLPYRQAVPDGGRVFVTLSRTTCWCENTGTRCANCEKVLYGTDATPGTPMEPEDSSFGKEKAPVIDSEDVEEDESDGDYGWTGGAEEGLPESDRPELMDEGIFDHMDANTEGTEDGELPPESTGSDRPEPFEDTPLGGEPSETTPGEMPRPHHPRPPPGRRETVPEDFVPRSSRPSTRETTSYVDPQGRRTHMVRKRRPEGDHLNFAFGIQPGTRKNVPVSMGHAVHQPSLGPSPNAEQGGGVVAYAKDTKEGGRVIEILDPQTGKKVKIGDPTGRAEDPKLVWVGDHVEVLYRVDGELKRARIVGDMESLEPINWPPPGTSVGRLLEAATTPDGKPFVVSVEGGEVAVEGPGGRETFAGSHGDAAYTKGGDRWLALRREDGSIVAVGPDGAVAPLVEASPMNGPPALLRTTAGGARLFFHRRMPAQDSVPEGAVGLALGGNFAIEMVDGTWGEPQRILMPEMPVDVAAVVLSMRLPYGQQHYSPMNMQVQLNGHPIGRIENKIPQGRYVFRVPPHLLRYASGAGNAPEQGNQVRLLISGIGRGHFHVTDSCGIYTRNRLVQTSLVARTAAEAEALAQGSARGTRHDAPDLVVASNGWELPRDAGPGEELAAKIGVFNAGDRPVPAGTLHWSIGGEVSGEATYPQLDPFRGRTLTVPVRLPDTWQPGTDLKLTVRAPVEGDADPDTNALDFIIMKELIEEVAGPTGPVEVDYRQLPEDAITTVDLSSGEPFEVPLSTDKKWLLLKAEYDRTLDVEVDGPDQDRVRDVQLFLDEQHVEVAENTYETVEWIYVRLDIVGAGAIPEGTVIRLSWQE